VVVFESWVQLGSVTTVVSFTLDPGILTFMQGGGSSVPTH
jgi:hypothetical protein